MTLRAPDPARLAAALVLGALWMSTACGTEAPVPDPVAASAQPADATPVAAQGAVGACHDVPKNETHAMLATISDWAGFDSAMNNQIAALLPRPLHRALFAR